MQSQMASTSSAKTLGGRPSLASVGTVGTFTEDRHNNDLPPFAHQYTAPPHYRYNEPHHDELFALYRHHFVFVQVDVNAVHLKQTIRPTLDLEGNALLNTRDGGVIRFGFTLDKKAVGFALNETKPEGHAQFLTDAVACFFRRFDPIVTDDFYTVTFIPVVGAPRSNTVVLEVVIKPSPIPRLFQNTKGMVHVVGPSGGYDGPLKLGEITRLLQSRFNDTMMTELNHLRKQGRTGSTATLITEPNVRQVASVSTLKYEGEPPMPAKPIDSNSVVDENDDSEGETTTGCCGCKKRRKRKAGKSKAEADGNKKDIDEKGIEPTSRVDEDAVSEQQSHQSVDFGEAEREEPAEDDE